MAFPTVANSNTSREDGNETIHTVSLPANISAGNLLLVFWTTDNNSNNGEPSFPEGWTQLAEESVLSQAVVACYYRKATGGEGASITVTTIGSERSTHISYRIEGAEDPDTQGPEVSTVASDISGSPNSSSVTPTGGAKDYMWISFYGNDVNHTTTGYPTGYNDNQLTISSSSTFGCGIGAASKEENDSSDDPDSFTMSSTEYWAAFTIAIHPIVGEPSVTNPKIKVSGTFSTKTIKTKISGTFTEKPLMVKVGGAFQ